MLRSCSCNFLYGENTDKAKQKDIWDSLSQENEYHAEINLYKRNGEKVGIFKNYTFGIVSVVYGNISNSLY